MSTRSLVFDRVGRGHIGSYMCIASNGVPPSISKRVDLRVQCENLSVFSQLIFTSFSPAHDDGAQSAGVSKHWRKPHPQM